DILLVGPGGQAVVLMSDVGGGTLASGLTLTFNEQGQLIPDEGPLAAGAYRASNVGSDDLFPAPAPAGPWGDSMAVFNNGDPNGTWRLFVVDDSGGGVGNINGGWRIDFETESAVVISEFRLRGPNGS